MYVCVWIMRAQSTRCVVMCQMEANYIEVAQKGAQEERKLMTSSGVCW